MQKLTGYLKNVEYFINNDPLLHAKESWNVEGSCTKSSLKTNNRHSVNIKRQKSK